MLTHPTLDQLRALKLDGMAQAFVELEAQEEVRNLTHAEWLALLLDREVGNRNTRLVRHRVVVLVDLDVIVDPDPAFLPFSEQVRLGRQRLEGRALQLFE